MSRDLDYEPEKYNCRSCKYFENGCKRVDGKKVNFAKNPFSCQAYGLYVCCDFELKDNRVYSKRNWIDFETYFKEFLEVWFHRNPATTKVYFVLNGNEEIRYGVLLKDYIYNNMYVGNKLKVVEKMYYKKTHTGFGYKLIREKINGVTIKPLK